MDGAPVVKAKRQQRGRTRAGCATCRLRRVKCDETKPVCLRCIKASRTCEWEVIKGFKQVSPTANNQVAGSASSINVITLPSRIPGTSLEQRGFDFFIKCTAPSLRGFFPSDFWQRTILQAGVDLPSLRHAIVAIGSVHESFLEGSGNDAVNGSGSDDTFALKQYNYSVQELQKDMKDGKCSLEVALICCALYISFDSLRGMTSSAVMHLHNGIKMLQAMQQKEDENEGPKIAGSMKDLRRLMSRLASQINSDMKDPTDPANDREDTISMLAESFGRLLSMHPLVPATTFSSLEEARDHLYSFINGHLYHYYLRSLYYGGSADQSHLEAPIASLQLPILNAMHSWSTAFESFLEDNKSTLTPQDMAAASLLQMHYQISYILIVGQIVPDEHGQTSLNTTDVFKPYSHNFGEALMLIESLILPPKHLPSSTSISSTTFLPSPAATSASTPATPLTPLTPASNTEYKKENNDTTHSSFYMDCGVVPMLFFIAMKCGDRRLRKKATDLLRVSHRREGTWDSETCLRIIEYNIAVEERTQQSSSQSQSNTYDMHSLNPSNILNNPNATNATGLAGNANINVTSPESTGSSSIGSPEHIDVEVVLKDERAKRYIEAGREEARRLERSFWRDGKAVRHSLLYL